MATAGVGEILQLPLITCTGRHHNRWTKWNTNGPWKEEISRDELITFSELLRYLIWRLACFPQRLPQGDFDRPTLPSPNICRDAHEPGLSGRVKVAVKGKLQTTLGKLGETFNFSGTNFQGGGVEFLAATALPSHVALPIPKYMEAGKMRPNAPRRLKARGSGTRRQARWRGAGHMAPHLHLSLQRLLPHQNNTRNSRLRVSVPTYSQLKRFDPH